MRGAPRSWSAPTTSRRLPHTGAWGSQGGPSPRLASRLPMLEIRPATDADLDGLLRVYLDAARHHAAIDPEVHHMPSAEDALVRVRGKISDPKLKLFAALEPGGDRLVDDR